MRLAALKPSPDRAKLFDPSRCSGAEHRPQTPAAAAVGAALDPATTAELRQLRALARRQAQELLKKAVVSKCLRRVISQTPDQ